MINDKNYIKAQTILSRFAACIHMTISEMRTHNIFLLVVTIYAFFSVLFLGGLIADGVDSLTVFFCSIVWCSATVFAVAFWGLPSGTNRVSESLQKAGLYNKWGEAPFLIRQYRDEKNPKKVYYVFFNPCIAHDEWVAKKSAIEAALSIQIKEILPRNGYRLICVTGSVKGATLPNFLQWKDCYLPVEEENSFLLALGESVFGRECIDLSIIPHWLIGSSTNGGKTKTLQLLLYQCCSCKACRTFIGDFKGGVDFSREFWQERCHIDLTRKAFAETLKDIVEEMEKRQQLLLEAKCANVAEYNRTGAFPLQHIIVACDEIAELIDTGDKEEKELTKTIMGYLKSIGRVGRAFSVHLILATQRPDADVLVGQIKSNLEGRLCGKCADPILSRIILGEGTNVDASAIIPKDSRGVFVQRDGVLIQCYYLDEDSLT